MNYKDVSFSLKDNFIQKYKWKQPKFGPLGYFTYKRTYARPTATHKTEEFWQTLKRVTEGTFVIQKEHCSNYHLPWNERRAQKSAQHMFQRMWEFKFLPPGRGLWAMGSEFAFKKGGACLNNCGFVSTKDISSGLATPFVWLMDMSLLGVGVGFDTKGAFTDKEVFLREPRGSSDPHVVEDSREGWVAVFRRILDAYDGKDSMPDRFDYRDIRAAGSIIKSFGGIAPGPAPLKELVLRTTEKLNEYILADKPVDSTLIVDLMNFAGAAVVAGGIRRSSEIALGTMDDEEFNNLKTKENLEDKSLARWASNNTHVVNVGDDYTEAAKRTEVNGEPGYFWIENAREYGRMSDPVNRIDHRVMGTNPCGEQSLESYELCNLVETFPINHEDLDDYKETLKFAYLYAKTVTLLRTHDSRTNQVMTRNRRIGLSQSGIIENINRWGFRTHMKWCSKGYKVVRQWDKTYSEWLGVPESIKKTTVKPSGSVSLLPGVTPGIHFPHSEYYLRRIRVAKTSHLCQAMSDAGYHVEPDVKEPNYTMVVAFPVHEPHFSKRKSDVSMYEQLELAAQMQAYWSDNQVSATVTISEGDDVAWALSMYETRLKSISFLPIAGGGYMQAPYEEINTEQYKDMVGRLKRPKLNIGIEDTGKELDKFCDTEVCEV